MKDLTTESGAAVAPFPAADGLALPASLAGTDIVPPATRCEHTPREWEACITSPTRGVMDSTPGAWAHCPSTTERVRVREVLPQEALPAPTASRMVQLDPADRAPGAGADALAAACKAAVDAAMGELALALGCVFSDLIPHNTGYFVPGEALARTDAVDAITALFTHVRVGGQIHRPLPGGAEPAVKMARVRAMPDDVDSTVDQAALF